MPTVTLPVTLVALTNENVNDLNANLNAIVAALNGGLDEVNVPNLTAAFTTYKTIVWAGGVAPATIVNAAGTWLLWGGGPGNAGTQNIPGAAASVSSGMTAFAYNPADYNANARTTNLRLRVLLVPNAVAPAMNFTVGLYPVATFGGAASANPTVATIGAVVAGSTVAVNTPGANSQNIVTSGDFTTASGIYVVGFTSSALMAATSTAMLQVQLQMHQV